MPPRLAKSPAPQRRASSPAPQRQGSVMMPTLENWKWTAGNTVTGNVYGKPGTPDGTQMMTSAVPPEGKLGTHVVRVLPQSALAVATAVAAGCCGWLLRVWPPARVAACERAADARRRIVQVTESGSSYLLGKPDPAEVATPIVTLLGYMLFALLTLFFFVVFLKELKDPNPFTKGPYCRGNNYVTNKECNLAHETMIHGERRDAVEMCTKSSLPGYPDVKTLWSNGCVWIPERPEWISRTPFILFCLASLGISMLNGVVYLRSTAHCSAGELARRCGAGDDLLRGGIYSSVR